LFARESICSSSAVAHYSLHIRAHDVGAFKVFRLPFHARLKVLLWLWVIHFVSNVFINMLIKFSEMSSSEVVRILKQFNSVSSSSSQLQKEDFQNSIDNLNRETVKKNNQNIKVDTLFKHVLTCLILIFRLSEPFPMLCIQMELPILFACF